MDGFYDVQLNGKSVGKVQVSREGLYYRFRCRCQLSSDSVCRLMANGVSLGILVPAENGFCLETRQPMKHFGEGKLTFEILPNRPVLSGRFIPIKPEEPFSYLERLKESYLAQRDGQAGVILPR